MATMHLRVRLVVAAVLGALLSTALVPTALVPSAVARVATVSTAASTAAAPRGGGFKPAVSQVDVAPKIRRSLGGVSLRFVVWRARGAYRPSAKIRIFKAAIPHTNLSEPCDRRKPIEVIRVPVHGTGIYSATFRPGGTYAWDVILPGDSRNRRTHTSCSVFSTGVAYPHVKATIVGAEAPYSYGDTVRARIRITRLAPNFRGRATIRFVDVSRKGCGEYDNVLKVFRPRVTGRKTTILTPRVTLGADGDKGSSRYGFSVRIDAADRQKRVDKDCAASAYVKKPATRSSVTTGTGASNGGSTVTPTGTSRPSRHARGAPQIIMGPTGKVHTRYPSPRVAAGEPARVAFAVVGVPASYRNTATVVVHREGGDRCGRRLINTFTVPVHGDGIYYTDAAAYTGTSKGYDVFYIPQARLPAPGRTGKVSAQCDREFAAVPPPARGGWVLPDAAPRVGEDYSAQITISGLNPDNGNVAKLALYGPVTKKHPPCETESLVRRVEVAVTEETQTFVFPDTVIPEGPDDGHGRISFLAVVAGDPLHGGIQRGCYDGDHNGQAQVED